MSDAQPRRCKIALDFDGEYRALYECSLSDGHEGPHEAWSQHIVTDDPLADLHLTWTNFEARADAP